MDAAYTARKKARQVFGRTSSFVPGTFDTLQTLHSQSRVIHSFLSAVELYDHLGEEGCSEIRTVGHFAF